MTHLPYIAAAYLLTVAVVLWLGLGAQRRLTRARRRLAALDPRAARRRAELSVAGDG